MKKLRKSDVPRNGINFSDCLQFFARQNDDRAKRLIAEAQKKFHRDGELEIDEGTITAGCDSTHRPGDYILAWVWVDDDQEVA